MNVAWKVVTKFEVLETILSDHPAPQCIIKVYRQDFTRRTEQRTQTTREKKREPDLSPTAQRLPGDKIKQRIGMEPPFERRPATDIENVDAATLGGDVVNCTIDVRNCAANCGGVLRCKERIRKMDGQRNR